MFNFGIISSHFIYLAFIAVYVIYIGAYSVNKFFAKNDNKETPKNITFQTKNHFKSAQNSYNYHTHPTFQKSGTQNSDVAPRYVSPEIFKWPIIANFLYTKSDFPETKYSRPPPIIAFKA